MSRWLHEWLAPLRRLARRPGFALAVLITLSLGVGANTVTFDLLYGYLLAPLPYGRSEQLVSVYLTAPSMPGNQGISYRTYFDMGFDQRASANALATAGMASPASYNLSAGNRMMHVVGANISASLLATLEVPPLLGRHFGPEANKPGAAPQVLISERLWRGVLDRDPAVVGKPVRIDGAAYVVAGVMPERFQILDSAEDVWLPQIFGPEFDDPRMIGDWGPTLIARLKPGVSLNQLVAQAQATLDQEIAHFPDPTLIPMWHKLNPRILGLPLRRLLLGELSEHLLLAQLATGLLLLLIWFNLVNLFIARALRQGGELIVRRVLGAQSPTLFRELLSESLTLCLLGSAAGFVLGQLAVGALLHSGTVTAALPPARAVLPVAGIALLLALLSALVFALAGLHFIHRQELAGALKEMDLHSSSGSGERRIRGALVITQLTIACLLTAIGAMLSQSLIQLGTLPLGFTPTSLLTFQISTPAAPQGRLGVLRRVAELRGALASLPGVSAASILSSLPFDGQRSGNVLFPYPFDGKRQPSIRVVVADGGYPNTLALPLRQGRLPQAQAAGSLPEAVLDLKAAQDLFGTTDAIGRAFSFNSPDDDRPNMRFRVSGIAGNARQAYTAGGTAMGTAYLDRGQVLDSRFFGAWYVAVRTALPPATLMPVIRQTLERTLPGVPPYDVRTMDQRMSQQLAPRQNLVTLVMIFAGAALLVAAVGLYAVTSYTVLQRQPELGIRAALGADQARLRQLVLQEIVKQLAIGIPLGLAGAIILGRVLARSFYGMEAADLRALAVVTAVLAFVTLSAGWVPAWRAGRVSALAALRAR